MISLQCNPILLASFPHKYVSYLLPALVQVRRDEGEKSEMERKVRVVVDMALAVSADGFTWSRALRRKIEGGAMSFFTEMRILSPVVWPLTEVPSRRSDKRKKMVVERETRPRRRGVARGLSGEDEDLRQSVRELRRIVPGGKMMGACELIGEVESYVACLELQVGILRSLLGAC